MNSNRECLRSKSVEDTRYSQEASLQELGIVYPTFNQIGKRDKITYTEDTPITENRTDVTESFSSQLGNSTNISSRTPCPKSTSGGSAIDIETLRARIKLQSKYGKFNEKTQDPLLYLIRSLPRNTLRILEKRTGMKLNTQS